MLFPWKLNRYPYGVQFGINCTALDQSKLNNFVEFTISELCGLTRARNLIYFNFFPKVFSVPKLPNSGYGLSASVSHMLMFAVRLTVFFAFTEPDKCSKYSNKTCDACVKVDGVSMLLVRSVP